MPPLKPGPAPHTCGILYRKVNGRELRCGRPPRHGGKHAQRMTVRELLNSLPRPRPKRKVA